MSGKLLCVLFALCLTQGLAAPKEVKPFNLIDDILNGIDAVIQEAKALLQKLFDILKTNGDEYIKKAQEIIDKIVSGAEDIIRQVGGKCGDLAATKIEEIKTNAEQTIKSCVVARLIDVLKVYNGLKNVISELETLNNEISTKASACTAQGSEVEKAVCLGKLAVEEEPKVKAIVDSAKTVIDNALAALDKLNGCIEDGEVKLQNEVNEVLAEVEKCLEGN